MTTTPPTGFADFLASSMPQHRDPSNWLSASMPKPADTTTTIPSESPPPRTFFLVSDRSYPVAYCDFTPPSNVLANVRPEIVVALVTSTDDAWALLKTELTGGTACLLLPDNRTITMWAPRIESWRYLDDALPGYPKSATGNRIGVLKLSCDPDRYRSA